MEYGIWSLQAAAGLWADPRMTARHFPLSPSAPDVLGQFTRHPGALGLGEATEQAMELTVKSSTSDLAQVDACPPQELTDNEDNEAENDDDIDNQSPALSRVNEHCEPGEVSDSGSTNSSHPSAVSNISNRTMDPATFFGFDKDETVTPVLNGWVLGAYTAMLGRLSAATAALEATELPSDSGSDSDASSYTEGHGSRGNSPIAGSYRGYPCGSCEVVTATRPALKKHILECHPALSPRSESSETTSVRQCPATGCEFSSSSRYEMETHVATHAASGVTSSGKKRLALQRVRYRYEREEYRCSLCSYACTIEKAFQRHLRAHAKGTAPKSRVSCAVCGADRSSEVDLSRHMRRHRDDRYFCCDICVFRTVQLKKLIQHRRMHTGEKPHLCPHCAYRSARRDNLRSHVRRVHKKENLYCDTFSPRGMLINASSSKSSDESTAALVHIPASSPSSNAAHEAVD